MAKDTMLDYYEAWRNKLPEPLKGLADDVAFRKYFLNGTAEESARYLASLAKVKGESVINSISQAAKDIERDGIAKYGTDLFNKAKTNIEGTVEKIRVKGFDGFMKDWAEDNKNDLPGYGGAVLGAAVGYGLLSELFSGIGTIGKIIIGGVTAVIGYFAAMKLTGGGEALEKKLNEKGAPAPLPPATVPDPYVPPMSYQGVEQKDYKLNTSFKAPEGIQLPTLQSTVAVTTADSGLKSLSASLPIAEKQSQQAPQISA
jgi:hypothetical protein